MPTETAKQSWIKFPDGRYVSEGRMQREGRMLSLAEAAAMDVGAFNREADQYGIHIEASDPLIDRVIKYAAFLSRRDKDGSAVMENPEYVSTALQAAARKAGEPFKSFYHMLTHDAVDAVGEILAFKERIATGANKDKYVAERRVFNADAALENAGDIIVAPEGCQRVLGMSGYPLETSKEGCRIENIEIPGLEHNDASGYWFIGGDPLSQERIPLRVPGWSGGGLLSASVGGGRSCSLGSVGVLRSRR